MELVDRRLDQCRVSEKLFPSLNWRAPQEFEATEVTRGQAKRTPTRPPQNDKADGGVCGQGLEKDVIL